MGCGWGRGCAGFSLVELLVVLAVIGFVMAGTLGLLVVGMKSYALGAARVEAQQAARVALERMVKELRAAGYDPTGAGLAAIAESEPTRVAFHVDANGNGVIDPTRERIVFLLRDGVLRRDAGGGAQPIVEGVRRFELSYFDRAGIATADPAQVRSIRVRVETGHASPGSSPGITPGITMDTEVSLRNAPP